MAKPVPRGRLSSGDTGTASLIHQNHPTLGRHTIRPKSGPRGSPQSPRLRVTFSEVLLGSEFRPPPGESEVAQSCPTLSDPMDYSLPSSSIHGIFQARALEWVLPCLMLNPMEERVRDTREHRGSPQGWARAGLRSSVHGPECTCGYVTTILTRGSGSQGRSPCTARLSANSDALHLPPPPGAVCWAPGLQASRRGDLWSRK